MSGTVETENVQRASDASLGRLATHAAICAEPVFRERGWTYGDSFKPGIAPDRKMLASTVARLLERAREEEIGDCLASGRFTITREVEEGREDLYVSLELGSTDDLS